MAEIIEFQKYRRICENCAFWVPPEKDGNLIFRDSHCGHPGGWTARRTGIYSIECNEFKRKTED